MCTVGRRYPTGARSLSATLVSPCKAEKKKSDGGVGYSGVRRRRTGEWWTRPWRVACCVRPLQNKATGVFAAIRVTVGLLRGCGR